MFINENIWQQTYVFVKPMKRSNIIQLISVTRSTSGVTRVSQSIRFCDKSCHCGKGLFYRQDFLGLIWGGQSGPVWGQQNSSSHLRSEEFKVRVTPRERYCELYQFVNGLRVNGRNSNVL